MTGCWLWTDHLVKGYGQFRVAPGLQVPAHVWAYEQKYGPVPDGLVLDHEVCDTRRCCNPDHVKPKTRGANTLRTDIGLSAINARKTHCKRGHPFSGDNLGTKIDATGRRQRQCRTCMRLHYRNYRLRKKDRR